MITIVDSLMGSGKTSYVIQEMLDKQRDKNFLFITPKLDDITDVCERTSRTMYSPKNIGCKKIDNIVSLLNNSLDIAATHELFRRFDDRCKAALRQNKYTLIMDEALSAVEQFKWEKQDDYEYLVENGDIEELEDGQIEWTGKDLETRFDDVRILAQNHCLFKIDSKFYLWHFPPDIFALFEDVYVLTYLFSGTMLKYYFDLFGIEYQSKSIVQSDDGQYMLVDYYKPDLSVYRSRFDIYTDGSLLRNIPQKENSFGATWCKSSYNKAALVQTGKNLSNYSAKKIGAKSSKIMWTTYKAVKKTLSNGGYARSFVECNCRGTNRYDDRTCLMYCINWHVHPEYLKFFAARGITIDQDAIALSEMIQWVWRSNIRRKDSTETIHLYIPSPRMRRLFMGWLYQGDVPATLRSA